MKKLKTLSDGNILYQNHRNEPYFTYLKEGKKTIEGRIYKKLYSEIAPGDYIEVQSRNADDAVLVKVAAIRTYQSFEDMLTHERIENVLPDISTIADGVVVYEQFYSKEQQETHGVVAIEVRLVSHL